MDWMDMMDRMDWMDPAQGPVCRRRLTCCAALRCKVPQKKARARHHVGPGGIFHLWFIQSISSMRSILSISSIGSTFPFLLPILEKRLDALVRQRMLHELSEDLERHRGDVRAGQGRVQHV